MNTTLSVKVFKSRKRLAQFIGKFLRVNCVDSTHIKKIVVIANEEHMILFCNNDTKKECFKYLNIQKEIMKFQDQNLNISFCIDLLDNLSNIYDDENYRIIFDPSNIITSYIPPSFIEKIRSKFKRLYKRIFN